MPDAPRARRDVAERAHPARGLHTRGHDGLPHPHVALPETFDAYLARFPSERRRRMRKHLQPLDRGRVTARTVPRRRGRRTRSRGCSSCAAASGRTAGKALLPALAEDRFRRFLTDVATRARPGRPATMVEYAVEGEPYAVYLDFMDARAFHGFMGGFEPSTARLEPGKLHILASIRVEHRGRAARGRTSAAAARTTSSGSARSRSSRARSR